MDLIGSLLDLDEKKSLQEQALNFLDYISEVFATLKFFIALATVVHIKLNRVSGHIQFFDFF